MFELFKTLLGKPQQAADLLQQAHGNFCEMLDLTGEILNSITGEDPNQHAEIAEEARNADKSSNRTVRQIRKLLVEHLGFSQIDAPACLVLMSVAKDGERIMDLVRELHSYLDKINPAFKPALNEQMTHLHTVLLATRSAFASSDEKAALDLVEQERPEGHTLDDLRNEIIAQTSDPAACACTFHACTLIKRIRAHLGNIASTVVFPIHRIDFMKGTFIKDARKRLQEA